MTFPKAVTPTQESQNSCSFFWFLWFVAGGGQVVARSLRIIVVFCFFLVLPWERRGEDRD